MKNEKLIYIILIFMVIGGMWVGIEIGRYEKKIVYDNLMFLLESERNLEAHENIKALEGLRDNKSEIIIEFMQVRVKSALDQEGIEDKTIARAKEYQRKYCEEPCLGVE